MTKKKALYIGDSSDDDTSVIYSTTKFYKKINEVPPAFVSSFLLEEISHSILHNGRVVENYIRKKNKLTNVDDHSNVDRFVLGKYLNNTLSDEDFKNFYYLNKSTIENIQQELLDNVALFRSEYTRAATIGGHNYEPLHNFLEKTIGISLKDKLLAYCNKNANKKVLGLERNQDYCSLGYSALIKALKESPKEDTQQKLSDYCRAIFKDELATIKPNTKSAQQFLTEALEFKRNADLILYSKQIDDIKDLLQNPDKSQNPIVKESTILPKIQKLATKIYIGQLNDRNKLFSNSLEQLRPNKLYLEDGDQELEFLSDFKLDHRILRNKVKTAGISKQGDTITHNVGIKQIQNNPTLYNYQISETNKIYGSASRSDEVGFAPGEGSYSKITEYLQNSDINGSELARAIKSVLKTGTAQDFKDEKYIGQLTYLLFRCEPERNASSFLTNAMFLELLENGIYTIEDIPNKMPMAMSEAVDAARSLLDQLGGKYGEDSPYLTKRQYYDFKDGDVNKAQELAARDTLILLDWLNLKTKGRLNLDHYVISNDENSSVKLKYFLTQKDDPREAKSLDNFLKIKGEESRADKRIDLTKHSSKTILDFTDTLNSFIKEVLNGALEQPKDELMQIDAGSVSDSKPEAIKDQIFKAFHNLVYEWYGIRLDWLYSFNEFKADNKDKFLSEQNNTLTEIIKKISNDKGESTLRFLSKDDIPSAIKIDNEIIIEIYKKGENSNWTVKLPVGFSEELTPAFKQLISALPPKNSGDTISLHDTTSLFDLIKMNFEKSKYLKDQFEKWVNELWNSQKTHLLSKSTVGLHNDQELLKGAKPVQGFYSDNDVMLLIQALLKNSGSERNNDPKTLGKISDKDVYILNSTSLSDGQERLDDLARDVCKILLMDTGTEKNILIPIRLQNEYHWVTAQLKIDTNNRITAYIHDSLYDNKCVDDDIIFQLSELLSEKEQMKQILGAKNISITFEDEEIQKLNLILNRFEVKKSIVEKIQKETSNVYCGGYTARIITNLVKTGLTEENKKEIWNCNSNKDTVLRKNDADIVNNSNLPNLHLFGTRDQSPDTLHTLSTKAENTRKNQTKHILERIKEDLNSSEQKGEILSKLKEITSTFHFKKEEVLDAKNDLLEATNIYNTLRTLQKKLVENNPLAKYIFKHNEESNLELDESGDVVINSDYQPNQLLFLLIETEKHLTSLEELYGANQTSEGLTADSINLNLDNIIKSYDQSDIYINSKVIDKRQILDNIFNWLENQNIFNQYASVIKIENGAGQKHAILLHAKKKNNSILLTLTDPLSEEDSAFKDELKKLAYSLQQNRIDAKIIHSGKQDKDYGTCGDTSLIMLQELIENTINQKVIDNHLIASSLCNFESSMLHNVDYDNLHSVLLGQDHNDTI